MNKDIFVKTLKLRHKLHQNPELSGEEEQTRETLKKFIYDNTRLEIVDKGLWFYAKYTPEEPTDKSIAFRADFDAIKVSEELPLPYCSVNKGISHKCGHDGHSAALAAFAMSVEQKGADCNVYFIFQHGEETGIGGGPASEIIEEEGIQEVYAIHNWPSAPFGSIGVREGTINCASKGMEIVLTGSSAHASEPEKGHNPAKLISKTILELDHITKPSKYDGLVMATVVQVDIGEAAFGVSAHKGRLLLTIRGENEEELLAMQKSIEDYVLKEAGEDFDVRFAFYDEFPETCNDVACTQLLRTIAQEHGWPINEFKEAIRSSEDFGYYLKKAPGALIWLGAGENWPPIHSEEFDYNDGLIERTVDVFWALTHKFEEKTV
ncbi:MAG: amidohydrolase [Firmicutes bacterium]|nr:amidohydrolase [Bacillota bacterium]